MTTSSKMLRQEQQDIKTRFENRFDNMELGMASIMTMLQVMTNNGKKKGKSPEMGNPNVQGDREH